MLYRVSVNLLGEVAWRTSSRSPRWRFARIFGSSEWQGRWRRHFETHPSRRSLDLTNDLTDIHANENRRRIRHVAQR